MLPEWRTILHNQRGVTLVEALTAAVLLAIVLVGAFGLYEQGVRHWVHTEANLDVQDNLRIAMDFLVRDIRQAREIIFPSPESPVDFNKDIAGETEKVLILIVPNGEEDVKVTYQWKTSGAGSERFVLDRRYGEGSPYNRVAYGITRVLVEQPVPGVVEIMLSGNTGYEELTVQTTVRARALSE